MKKLKLSSSLKEHKDIHTQHGAFLLPHILCSQGKSQSMASKNRTIRKRKLNTPRTKCKQRSRRRDSLFRKAFEDCCECDADIFLMIRLKHNGQIFMFNSDSGWPPMQEDMVGTAGCKNGANIYILPLFQALAAKPDRVSLRISFNPRNMVAMVIQRTKLCWTHNLYRPLPINFLFYLEPRLNAR